MKNVTTEVKRGTPSNNNLATNTAPTVVEKKISNVSNLIKKTDDNTNSNEIEKKITDYHRVKYITADNFAARLAQANLVTKTDFDDKLKNLNKNINSNKTKHVLVENELKKLETFDSIYFRGKSHFEDDDTKNYLVF